MANGGSPDSSHASPVVSVGFLVSMVVRVVVVFPHVGLFVDVVGLVNMSEHPDVSKAIMALNRVMEGQRSEGVEQVGIDFFSLENAIP